MSNKFNMEATITPEMTIRITEGEARALYALTTYGFESFIAVFYKNLGETYMKPHEKSLKSLFDNIRGESGISVFLKRCEDARAVFRGEKFASPPATSPKPYQSNSGDDIYDRLA